MAAAGEEVTGQGIYNFLSTAEDLRLWPGTSPYACGAAPDYPTICSFTFPFAEYAEGGELRDGTNPSWCSSTCREPSARRVSDYIFFLLLGTGGGSDHRRARHRARRHPPRHGGRQLRPRCDGHVGRVRVRRSPRGRVSRSRSLVCPPATTSVARWPTTSASGGRWCCRSPQQRCSDSSCTWACSDRSVERPHWPRSWRPSVW